jgi:nitroimidazol reductase NimA-like FMN-containing flavoprotein (pyridoxamine 5'-phosphate oxidase superfamily)
MYQEMRRKQNQASEAEAYEFLDRAEWGVLSLAANGLPYGVPMSHAISGKTIYFHCALEGQKLDFIRANPVGWYTAVASAQCLRDRGAVRYESVMAYGPLRIVQDEAERLKGFNAINAKFTESEELGRSFIEKWGKDAAVVALDIERITAKGNRKEQ